MAIKKVWLDESEDECTSCNLCADIAHDVFEVPDKMTVKAGADLETNDALSTCLKFCCNIKS